MFDLDGVTAPLRMADVESVSSFPDDGSVMTLSNASNTSESKPAAKNKANYLFAPLGWLNITEDCLCGTGHAKKPSIDFTGTYSQEVLRPIFVYMSALGLNHTFSSNQSFYGKMYNIIVFILLVSATLRKFTQVGERTIGTTDFSFRAAIFDPAVVMTLCHCLFMFSGSSAAFMLLLLQRRWRKVYEVLDEGLGKGRAKEQDGHLLHVNRVLVAISCTLSTLMALMHLFTKLGILDLPQSPPMITNNIAFILFETYIIFVTESSILMLATLFCQLCLILRASIRRLIDEMIPEHDMCPTTEQSLIQIHDVQVHYQEIYNAKALIEENFSFAIFFTYGCCIPMICFLSYILVRNTNNSDLTEILSLAMWMFNTIVVLLFFSFPAFIVQEEGEQILSSCFRMYHETLCEHRDLLVMSQMQFLAIQMHTSRIQLTAGNFFVMTRKILLTLVSAICTYFLILIQFESEGKEKKT